MKTKNLFVAFSFIFLSCMNAPEEKNKTISESISTENPVNPLKKHAFIDAKTGLTVFEKNFPSHWNVISKPSYALDNYLPTFLYKIQTENGLKGFNIDLQQFITYDNYNYGEMMKSYSTKNIKPFMSANTILDQELKPAMQKIGFTKIKTYTDQNILNYLNKRMAAKGMGSNNHIEVLVTDWTNNQGKNAMTLLVQFVLKSPDANGSGFTIWNYGADFLFTPEKIFNQEKTAFLTMATNYKENPKWEEYRKFTLDERQLAADRQLQRQNDNFAAQNAAFQQRMRDQKSNFDAHQNMMKERYAANDANHESYMNTLRSSNSYSSTNSSDQNQQSFINMIREEQVVTNSAGEKYLVESHSDRYWMNSNGEYIKTDDSFFNPNGDLNLNNQNWELVKKTNH
mgnify:FL=1